MIIKVPKHLKMKPRLFNVREQVGSHTFKVEYQGNGNDEQQSRIQMFKRIPLIQLGDREVSILSDEIETLSALDHLNLIKLIGISDDPDSTDGMGKQFGVGMMTEYCENGILRQCFD